MPNKQYEFNEVKNIYFGKIIGTTGMTDLNFEKLDHDITMGRFNFGVQAAYEIQISLTVPGTGGVIQRGDPKQYGTGIIFNIDEGKSVRPN